jgi:hypothetical protein
MNHSKDPTPEAARSEHHTVLTGGRARQGVTGHNVRYVLGFGLAGAILALAVVYIAYFAPHLGS